MIVIPAKAGDPFFGAKILSMTESSRAKLGFRLSPG
jgi:hypothetical protein